MAEKESEPKDLKEFDEWLKENRGKTIRIMVSGKKGAGKSSLLNFVFGTEFVSGKTLMPGTTVVTKKYATKDEINLEIFDCPGLEDGASNDKQYLKDIGEKCQNIHLLIFCISMIAPRANLRSEASALNNITKVLGKQIWENAVVCLTFANMYEKRIRSTNRGFTNQQVLTQFESIKNEWCAHLADTLRRNNVEDNVITNILKCLCIGGHSKIERLPGVDHWITEVWIKCVTAMPLKVKPLAIQMEIQNMMDAEDAEVKEYKEQALLDPTKRKLILSPKAKAILGLTAASGTAVVTGATIGATIGTFAIGLPTFGVAAGAGLVIGGVVGAGAGLAVSVLYGLFKLHKKKKAIAES